MFMFSGFLHRCYKEKEVSVENLNVYKKLSHLTVHGAQCISPNEISQKGF